MFRPEVIQNLERHAARQRWRAKTLYEVVSYNQDIKEKMPAYVIGYNDDNPLMNKGSTPRVLLHNKRKK